ncbi:MAG TPA: ABC transporter permease [Streptosporangiaceae bacterium]|jgi:putative ABC transport system permease protein
MKAGPLKAGPVARAVRGGLTRRRVQLVVTALVVLVSTTASILALSLVVDSNSPFDHSFAAQHGAHLVATFDTAKATPAGLAATRRLPGVTAASGPFPTADVVITMPGQGGFQQPIMVAGRASAGGPVDDVTLQQGHWPTGPGQIVLADNPASNIQLGLPDGSKVVATNVPGQPRLTVVGTASSVSDTAAAWVTPAEATALRPQATKTAQMLYRFTNAGTTAAIKSDTAELARALPKGSLTDTQSYLTVRLAQTSGIAPFVPFLIAFGIIGLVLSVLIVANVVSGAVVAGYRRIGILKSLGFTPSQVVGAYTGLVTVPAVVGGLAGLVLGNVLAKGLLAQTANAYNVGALGVPLWVNVAVPLGMLVLVAAAAVAPALRAGRLSAVQAIAAGRAPTAGRGYAAHRLLGRLRLPRPVTIGLAAPFARPARTTITLAAVLLGAITVTFAVGLAASLSRVVGGLSHAGAEPVQITTTNFGNFTPAQQQAIQAALRAEPGTLHQTAETDGQIGISGLAGVHPVTAFTGDSSWTGYPLISGRWYTGPGQADVSTGVLTETGKSVGDTITITLGTTQIPVKIVGQLFDSQGRGVTLVTSTQTLAPAGQALAAPDQYDVGLRAGTNAGAYEQALTSKLGSSYGVSLNARKSIVVSLMVGLIGTLTLLLAVVSGLGVLNTVVLNTRERVHDIGVFKAVGMTPRQTIAMVVCWVAGTGLVAGLIAVPAGIALHHLVLPEMASSANLGLPASYLNVYGTGQIALLALAGVAIAVAGALLPAGWAAKIRTASALRAE